MTSSTLLLQSYRHNNPAHSSPLLVISTTSLSATFPVFQQFVNCSTKENKLWICFKQTLEMHTAPLQNLLWARQIITWYISPQPINPLSRGNQNSELLPHKRWTKSDLKEKEKKELRIIEVRTKGN